MTFLRAFPLALSILWRYLIALPVLILILIAFGFLAVIVFVIAGLVSPFAAIILAVAFGVGASAMPLMVGMRVGLQSYQVRPQNSYPGMLKPAIGYGLFEAVVNIIFLAIAVGIFILITPLTLADVIGASPSDGAGAVELFVAANPMMSYIFFGGLLVATMGLRACLLVPFAGASVGMDPNSRPHTPFYGFGRRFFSIFALVVLAQAGSAFVLPAAMIAFDAAGILEPAMQQIAEIALFDDVSDIALIGPEGWGFIGFSCLILLFFFSLQCAGAVLVFIDERRLVGARQKARDAVLREEEERASPTGETDLRALLRSRMPEKKY